MITSVNVLNYIRENNLKGPVASSQIFMGRTMQFHPQGLFSEEIFGMEGSRERRGSLSWIELNCNVIQPPFYDILFKKIERKIEDFLKGDIIFTINDEGNLIEDENGEIDGFSAFYKNIHKIKFRKSDTGGDRDKLIDMLYDNIDKGTFFTDRLLIIPPDFRPIIVGEDQRDIMKDEMNDIYQKLINVSNQIRGVSGTMYDVLNYKIQMVLKDLYEYVKVHVAKKQGAIRNLMLGKRVDFSARAVITPGPTLRLGEVGIPLVVAASIFEPQLIYGLVNSPESQHLSPEFHESVKEFLGKELDPELIL